MFKIQTSFLSALMLLTLAVGCSSSAKTSKTFWLNEEKAKGKTFNQVFVFVASLNIEARVRIESALAAEATAKGIKVVKSKDLLPPALSDTALPSKEALMNAIQLSGSDGVFIISLLDKDEIIDYKQGKTAYGKTAVYTWNGGLWGYYSDHSLPVNTRSTINQETKYKILSNLYDVSSEELMFSIESNIYEATNIDKTVEWYVRNVMAQMQNNHLIKN